jgi:hypothetical protein
MTSLISLVDGGFYESCRRYAESMMSSSQLPSHACDILTGVASLEQSSNKGRALI